VTVARHIAFLRGVNVGGHQVPMAKLRTELTDLGFTEVETLINSGNVAFVDDSRRKPSTIEKAVETHLREWLGYDVATFLRSPKELAAVAECAPFPELPTNGTVHVHFLKAAPPASVQRNVIACEAGDDRFAFAGRELYWWCPSKMMDSPVDMKAVGKLLGPLTTSRNITTVRRLAAKYPLV
jgi:uncharacterized protein (DUF1697 family)